MFSSLLTPMTPVVITPLLAVSLVSIAAILSVPRVTWQYFGLFTTLVHELGHASAAVLTGRLVHGIRIRRNHSGDALSSGRGEFGAVVSGIFGYPAPAIVALGLLWSVFHGYIALALLVGAIVLVLTILVIRNIFGAIVVVMSAAMSAALWFYFSPEVQSYALLVLGISLIVGSVRGLMSVIAVHLHASHSRDHAPLSSSDAYLLARRTGVPSFFWLALFAILIGGCCVLAVMAYLSR